MQMYSRVAWLVIGVWFLFCLVTLNYNGPFYDEATQIVAGLRTFEGHGYSDRYLVWFGGSLLWPVLAGIGFKIGGLVGTRVVALLLAAMAFSALVKTTENLFGPRASFWTALTFAVNGPFFALARLGVYDVAALPAIAVSFWAVTELQKKDHRFWLVVAALSFTVGMLAKYPIGLMLFPILGVLLVLRKLKAFMDIGIFGFISLGIALAFFLSARGQLAAAPSWQFANKPTFDVTPQMIGFALLYMSAAPFLLATGGWFAAQKQRLLASVLLLSLIIWPVFHLSSSNPVSTNKHVVFGFLFAYPLIGLGLSTLLRETKPIHFVRQGVTVILLIALAAVGVIQVHQLDRAWPDTRQAAKYLVNAVQPGQQLLINESWEFILYLYEGGKIDSPWQVYDVYRVANGESQLGLCQYDWFVDAQGSYKWPASIEKEIERCGSFRQVFSTTSTVVGLGRDLEYVSYPVRIDIWVNTSKG